MRSVAGLLALGLALLADPAGAADDWTACLQSRADPTGGTQACSRVLDGVRDGTVTITGANYSKSGMEGRVYAQRARGHAARGDDAAALRDYDAALRLIKQLAWVYVDRGELHARAGNAERARQDFRQALQLDPADALARDGLYRLGETPTAAAAPPAPPAPPPLAPAAPRPLFAQPQDALKACAEKQAPAEAVAACTAVIDAPDAAVERKAAAHRLRAKAHAAAGATRQALADLSAALRLQPGDAASRRERAQLLSRLARPQEALEDYRSLAQIDPDDAAAKQEIARLERQLADAAAEAERQKALVRRAQTALAKLGHPVGAADGNLRSRTVDALRKWQQGRKLPASGKVDAGQLALLEADAERKANVAKADPAPPTARPGPPPAVETPPPAETATAKAPPVAGAEAGARVAELGRATTAAGAAPAASRPPVPPRPRGETLAPRKASGQQKMVALVIGNGAYRNAPPLPNPANDASDVAAALGRIGFTVFKGIDLDRLAMEDMIVEFARQVPEADVALAYYAGHGVQVRNRNYLLPVEATLADERDLRRLIQLDYLIEDTSKARRVGIVIVDACRDNPLTASLSRSIGSSRPSAVGSGLAEPVHVPNQTLIAYATQPLATAADGVDRNSPFTAALLEHLDEPGVDVRLLFGKVREAVVAATRGGQSPPVFDMLGGDPAYLVPPVTIAALDPEDLVPAERLALQRALKRLGFYRGEADSPDPNTLRIAISSYQWQRDVRATGQLTAAEMVELHAQARGKRPEQPIPAIDFLKLSEGLERGDPQAQELLATVHDTGFAAAAPFPKSNELAVRWYRRAAQAGAVGAAERLGLILVDGDGVPADPVEAARWLKVAADAGRLEPQLAVAELYLKGLGLAQDKDEAIRLLRVAAEHADGGAAVAQLRLLGVI